MERSYTVKTMKLKILNNNVIFVSQLNDLMVLILERV